MTQYAGECVGGPWNGRQQVHFATKMEIAVADWDEVSLAQMMGQPLPNEVPVSFHCYEFDADSSKWMWRE